jgi:hypothetical protein
VDVQRAPDLLERDGRGAACYSAGRATGQHPRDIALGRVARLEAVGVAQGSALGVRELALVEVEVAAVQGLRTRPRLFNDGVSQEILLSAYNRTWQHRSGFMEDNAVGHVPRRGLPMAESTTIEWTNATWNPVTGCTDLEVVELLVGGQDFLQKPAQLRDVPLPIAELVERPAHRLFVRDVEVTAKGTHSPTAPSTPA